MGPPAERQMSDAEAGPPPLKQGRTWSVPLFDTEHRLTASAAAEAFFQT